VQLFHGCSLWLDDKIFVSALFNIRDDRHGMYFGAKPGRIAALAANFAYAGKRPRLAKALRR
jgi:hypothetical protein